MVDVRHFDAMFEANPLALLLVDKQLKRKNEYRVCHYHRHPAGEGPVD